MSNQMVFQRYELKYLITRCQQAALLAAMGPHVVEDTYAHSSIRNLYVDTPSFRLIRRSLEKPVYKEKIRIRSYGRASLSDPVFVELKKKYRSVVYKRRLSLPQHQALACMLGVPLWPDTQIGNELAYTVNFYRPLSPAVFLSYERDSYHGVEDPDLRVTFDRDIRFRQESLTLDSTPWGTSLLDSDQVLMELKIAGGMPLWLTHILSELEIYQTSYSKYGAAYQLIQARTVGGERKYA